MSLSRITTRFSRTVLTQCRNSVVLFGRHESKSFHSLSNHLIAPRGPTNKVVSGQVSLLNHPALNPPAFQWYGFSSSTSPHPNEKKTAESGNEQNNTGDKDNEAQKTEESVSDGKIESDSDLESELSRDDLVKLVAEKEQVLLTKQEELEQMKDKVLRAFAEMENVKERTRRESDNTKKFAIQNFAKSLLDVGDNLGRASSAAKESFSKIDASKDPAGAVQQLKTLLEGVEMTEKQLAEVFKKFGLEKYSPVDEEFDPNRHNAVFQVPDASKPADRVAIVLKAGYMLHDRVIRPAEVGVTVAVNNEEAEEESKA
ncbi:hypothetical protein BUALT_Bualt18G0070300 [Buddleja alternifolia]|uniref:GrpE protein homolog n=1 Tax=Buddleja alternifolia TaxID=168488 RepID=A0AAV6WDR6_9LAMI|nr:hypothetical protein BUALT_Bualt18G0070300 [Buddleja alternifolia]